MDKAICPVCKFNDDTHVVYVPLGHGRYCQYLCLRCDVLFPWGSNRFGDITQPEQIKKVFWLANYFTDNWPNTDDIIPPQDHPDFRERFVATK